MIKKFISVLLLLVILSSLGCTRKEVKKFEPPKEESQSSDIKADASVEADATQNDNESPSPNDFENDNTVSTTVSNEESKEDGEEEEAEKVSDSSSSEEIIIAQSNEGSSDEEKEALLAEIDALLTETLNTLESIDNVETSDLIQEGGE